MLTSYLQSLQLNVDKFSTCTYKLQIGYNIIIIVLVFTTQVTKLPPKCSHSHQKKKETLSQPLTAAVVPTTHRAQRRWTADTAA